MAGSAPARFPLIRNNSSCKTPEPDYPKAFPSGLGSSHFLPGFRRRLPKGFPSYLGSLTSSHTSEEEYPRAFLQASGVLASSHTSEEEHPRAFLQASEVSHPPILPKKTSQGLSFKPRLFSPPLILSKKSTRWLSSPPWKLSLPAWLSKKTTQGLSFKPRKSHILPYFRRSVPDGFPSSLGSLTSSQTSEEDYPRAFLQALEVSHPPILPKKTTQRSDYSSSGGSRVLMMAFSNSAIPTAPRCIKGLPSIGMKRREGIERIPNRAARSFSSSTLTL